jgi:hypothetical protein
MLSDCPNVKVLKLRQHLVHFRFWDSNKLDKNNYLSSEDQVTTDLHYNIAAYFIPTCHTCPSYNSDYEGKSLPECDAMQSGRNLLPSLHNIHRHLPDYTTSYYGHPYSKNQGVLVIGRSNSIAGQSLARKLYLMKYNFCMEFTYSHSAN